MRLVSFLAVLVLAAGSALAETVRESHGISRYGDLKYDETFRHFDYANPDAPKGGEARFFGFGGFDTLNAYSLRGRKAAGLSRLYDTLLKQSNDEPTAAYGLLADRVRVPDDHSWVAFRLRPEARWHDGTPVTADDVVWSLETLRESGLPLYATYYANVAQAVVEDGGWVRFTFDGPGNVELPLILGELPILPRHWYEGRDFEEASLDFPMGSGPYRVVDVDPGRSITYARHENYWGADLPVNVGFHNFDRIRYDEYLDLDIAMEAFKANEYDFRSENNSKRWATSYSGSIFDDGLVVVEKVAHSRPQGMQGFVFNLRREKFTDPKVRQALALAFDFEWANQNLFYGQYLRSVSYFSNSELAASGTPDEAERALLERHGDGLPEAVFGEVPVPPVTDGSGNNRTNLRKAKALLAEAGWTVQDGVLTGPAGTPMEIEFLMVQPAFERILQPFRAQLERLGARLEIRPIDAAQYKERLDNFDFDMVVTGFGQSRSPGNEQRNYWSSAAADISGSNNLAGIRSPAIDALIEELIYAGTRAELVTAARVLDRVLRHGHYVIPNWHITYDRVAWWDRFGQPDIVSDDGIVLDTWWIDSEREAALKERIGSEND